MWSLNSLAQTKSLTEEKNNLKWKWNGNFTLQTACQGCMRAAPSLCLLLPSDQSLLGNAEQNDADAHRRQAAQHGEAVGYSQRGPLLEEERGGEDDGGCERHVVDGFKHVGAETLQGLVDEEELDEDAHSQRPQQPQEESQSPAAPGPRPRSKGVRSHQAQALAAWNREAPQEGAYGDVHHDV